MNGRREKEGEKDLDKRSGRRLWDADWLISELTQNDFSSEPVISSLKQHIICSLSLLTLALNGMDGGDIIHFLFTPHYFPFAQNFYFLALTPKASSLF